MGFLQFLGYYLASEFVLALIGMMISITYRKVHQRKLQKMVNKGQIRLVTEEELIDMQRNGNKPWN